MLTKSKTSAFILSLITVVSFSATSALVNILIPYLISGDIGTVIARPESLKEPGQVISLVGVIIILLMILTGIGTFWLYRFFGERYYGKRSALRWALFGIIFALLLKSPDWLIPERLWLLSDILRFASVFIAFFLTRWIIPLESEG